MFSVKLLCALILHWSRPYYSCSRWKPAPIFFLCPVWNLSKFLVYFNLLALSYWKYSHQSFSGILWILLIVKGGSAGVKVYGGWISSESVISLEGHQRNMEVLLIYVTICYSHVANDPCKRYAWHHCSILKYLQEKYVTTDLHGPSVLKNVHDLLFKEVYLPQGGIPSTCFDISWGLAPLDVPLCRSSKLRIICKLELEPYLFRPCFISINEGRFLQKEVQRI